MISRRYRSVSFVALAALGAGCSSAPAGTSAPVVAAPHAASQPTASWTAATPEKREEWRKTLSTSRLPKKGCFQVSHPSAEWVEIPCGAATKEPMIASRPLLGAARTALGTGNDSPAPEVRPKSLDAIAPESVGNTVDTVSGVASGLIDSMEGTFPSVTNVTSETDNGAANVYSLQMNTNRIGSTNGLTGTLCNGASSPFNCSGWEQFIYDAAAGTIYAEYWLLNYNNSCPSGWSSYKNNCFVNSSTVSVPSEPITNLANLTFTGSTGGGDFILFTTGAGTYYAAGWESVLSLETDWTAAEFNVFGNLNSTNAQINSSSANIVVQTLTTSLPRTTAPPVCNPSFAGFTGETNSLGLTGSCCAFGGSSPGIRFDESGTTGGSAPFVCPAPPQCAYTFACNGGGQVSTVCTPDSAGPSDPITIYQVEGGQNQQIDQDVFNYTYSTPTLITTISTLASTTASATYIGCTTSAWGGQNCDPTPTTVSTPSCVGVTCGSSDVYDTSGQCVAIGSACGGVGGGVINGSGQCIGVGSACVAANTVMSNAGYCVTIGSGCAYGGDAPGLWTSTGQCGPDNITCPPGEAIGGPVGFEYCYAVGSSSSGGGSGSSSGSGTSSGGRIIVVGGGGGTGGGVGGSGGAGCPKCVKIQ